MSWSLLRTLTCVVCLGTSFGQIVAMDAGADQASGQPAKPNAPGLIASVTDFSFNQRWVNGLPCGRRMWYAMYCSPNQLQAIDVPRYAWLGRSEKEILELCRVLADNASTMGDEVVQNQRLTLFREGKIPLTHICMRSKARWDGSSCQVRFADMPAKADVRMLAKTLGKDFTGWSVCGEWGHCLATMVEGVERASAGKGQIPTWGSLGPEFTKAMVPHLPTSRRAFADMAAKVWRAFNEPLDYQGEALDGTYYWAIQWPAILGARSIITENRYQGRSQTLFQAFTRAAGRMGNIPWGFAPGANTEILWGVPPYRSNIARFTEQGARGWCPVPPSQWQRLLHYWCMGGAAIVRDEETHRYLSDPENNGTWQLNWYSQMVEEVFDFADRHPDRGTAYTPIGLLLAWDNMVCGVGGNWGLPGAAPRFEYDEGEHMTRELLNRVLYPTGERNSAMDFFGASPYGDIFDPLRIDTPKGPLPIDLLKNYKVLCLVGRQNLDEAIAERLREYVAQGGVLLVNVKQLAGDLLGREFTGVVLAQQDRTADAMTCRLDGKRLDSGPYTYTPLSLAPDAVAIYDAARGDVVVARHPFGKGQVITVGAHWMLEDRKTRDRRTVLPLAGDLIGRLVQAVLPFEVRGDHVAQRVLYQANRKGAGWVISLYNNAGREGYGNSGPEKVWPDRAVEVELRVPPDAADAVEWLSSRRLAIVRDKGASRGVIRLGLEPGDVRIIEIQPVQIPPVKVVERVNLALRRPVKASSFCEKEKSFNGHFSFYLDHGPDMAVNGNRDIYNAWWSKGHADPATPQWLEVDLGEVKKVNCVNPVFMWSEDQNVLLRAYRYFVETSVDGKTWTRAVDESMNMTAAHRRGSPHFLGPVAARYVRITIIGNTATSGAQLVEFEVYGDEKAPRTYEWTKP